MYQIYISFTKTNQDILFNCLSWLVLAAGDDGCDDGYENLFFLVLFINDLYYGTYIINIVFSSIL
jgi:hypothetical protein